MMGSLCPFEIRLYLWMDGVFPFWTSTRSARFISWNICTPSLTFAHHPSPRHHQNKLSDSFEHFMRYVTYLHPHHTARFVIYTCIYTVQLKLLVVWILTGSGGLVLPLDSTWMGESGFWTRMVWSRMVLGFQTNSLVWVCLAWYDSFLFAVPSHSPLDLLPSGATSPPCRSPPSDVLSCA